MHPIFKSKTALAVYVFTWLPFAFQAAVTLHIAVRLTPAEIYVVVPALTIALALACLSPWYICRALPLRTTWPPKLVGVFLVAAILTNAVVVGFVRLAVHFEARFSPDLDAKIHTAIPVISFIVLLLYLLAVALHYTLLAVESSKQAELLSREAELKALKAQINPHFLFNSLNSISALALAEPTRAREMCIKLSDFLRISLRLGERLSIPLKEELELTRTYLDVEQIRFGQRLRVRQTMDPQCGDCEIPPLLVQPLVENAIKHGIATLVDGGEVQVTGTRGSNGVRVTVMNPFDPDAPDTGRNGLGLINVRNRLQARYRGAARMDIKVDREFYRVTLELPCQEQLG